MVVAGDTDNSDPVPDPLANLAQLFYFIVNIILGSLVKILPIITIGFLMILAIFYLIFKWLGLT